MKKVTYFIIIFVGLLILISQFSCANKEISTQANENFVSEKVNPTETKVSEVSDLNLTKLDEPTKFEKPKDLEYSKNDKITLMAYNLENFFDLKKDNAFDTTFLPLKLKQSAEHKSECAKNRSKFYLEQCLNLDWNQEQLNTKMKRLSQVVLQINNGQGPDILSLSEVENKDVLDTWNLKYLKSAQYRTSVLIEGFDQRGIDVALLSRLPLYEKPVLHRIPFRAKDPKVAEKMQSSRGVLEVTLVLPDQSLITVYNVHFPSQANPTEFRKQAIDFVNSLQSKLPADRLSYVAGDFNISSKEDQEHQLYTKDLAKKWEISHLIGCKTCKGSYFYFKDQTWSFLDAFAFSPNMVNQKSAWTVNTNDIYLVNENYFQNKTSRNLAKLDEKTIEGPSDHWAIVASLVKTKK